MSESLNIPETVRVPVGEPEEREAFVEHKLQQVYGSGTYLSDFYEASDGEVVVEIGNSFPKDVSDCRSDEERVIKFIAIDDIAELAGERDDRHYIIEIKDRDEVEEGFTTRKQEFREELDQVMAKATYDKIAQTPTVENQLNPIKEILRWTREYHPVSYEEVWDAQNSDNTRQYVHTLEELGFIRLEDGKLFAERPLSKYDIDEIPNQEFNERILGEVVEAGFRRLSEDLNLTVLRNLPRFANGYYLDAVERNNPDLHLDLPTIRENIKEWYGHSNGLHRFKLRDKLDELASLEILKKTDEGYYKANKDTYQDFVRLAGI